MNHQSSNFDNYVFEDDEGIRYETQRRSVFENRENNEYIQYVQDGDIEININMGFNNALNGHQNVREGISIHYGGHSMHQPENYRDDTYMKKHQIMKAHHGIGHSGYDNRGLEMEEVELAIISEPEDYTDDDQIRNRNQWKKAGKLFMTMNNAKKIAIEMGLMFHHDQDSNNESGEKNIQALNDLNLFPNRQCWSRKCNSKNFHSHRLFGKMRLQQNPNNDLVAEKNKWDLHKSKTERQIKEYWKELRSRFYVWSGSMKTIEGQFGTGVVSYFVFLRWLLFLNLLIFVLVFSLIILPYLIKTHSTKTEVMSVLQNETMFPSPVTPLKTLNDSVCWSMYQDHVRNSSRKAVHHQVQDFLQGTGWLEISLLFSGVYEAGLNFNSGVNYNLSLAYICVTLSYFVVCLVMMVMYTSKSVHESLMTSQSHLHKYCNLVFGSYDFCIQEKKTAERKHQSIFQEFESSLGQEKWQRNRSSWSRKQITFVFVYRGILNLIVFAILLGAGWGIFEVCKNAISSGNNLESKEGFEQLLLEFMPSITITLLNLFLPFVFGQIVKIEKYSTDFEIKVTLVRTVFVRLASIGVLVWTFYSQINCENKDVDNDCGFCNSTRCWETYVGQQLYKLVVLDFIVVLITTFIVDFPRRLLVDKCSNETNACSLAKIIGRQEFDIPKHVLDLVYSQTLCWLGTFYSPLLPAICVAKFIIFFYLKKLTLLSNCVPSKTPYRASRSNTFFIAVLMLAFVLSVIPVGFSIAKILPSRSCGPFRSHPDMWSPITEAIENSKNKTLANALNFLASAGFAVPLFILICLAIYYYVTISSAHKRMIKVLKEQLILEGKDKQFLLNRLIEVAKRRQN